MSRTGRRTVTGVMADRQAARGGRAAGRPRYSTDTEMQRVQLQRMAARGDEKATAALAAYAAAQRQEQDT